ncbi:hypothetical protein [Nocardia sp. NPDC056000]|uniref:hypothetical protein n=1 Tax=Nocardia sp. NPDC056000 TaxID=3345674 RepID=UPI0035D8F99A
MTPKRTTLRAAIAALTLTASVIAAGSAAAAPVATDVDIAIPTNSSDKTGIHIPTDSSNLGKIQFGSADVAKTTLSLGWLALCILGNATGSAHGDCIGNRG